MSSSSLWVIIVLLLVGSACADTWIPITTCTTIDTPGGYSIAADLIYNSSLNLPCLNIVDSVIPGNTSLTIFVNNSRIWCQDDAGCLPAIQVAPGANMQLTTVGEPGYIFLKLTGNYKTHIVDGGDNCNIGYMQFQHYSASGDAIRCGTGSVTMQLNSFYQGYSTGLLNAQNATSFFIDSNNANMIYGIENAIQVGNGGNGTISNNVFYSTTGAANCNSAGDFAGYGDTADHPAASCYDILEKRGADNVTDGVYWIFHYRGYPVEPIYCDFSTTAGKAYQLMYKINNGTDANYGALVNLWTNVPYGTEYLNPAADVLSNKPSTSYYASNMLLDHQHLLTISMRAYLLENLVMFIDFNNGTAGTTDWFLPSHIAASSYTDLPTSDSFSGSGTGKKFIANNGDNRFWYINQANDDCDSDIGWVLIGAPSKYYSDPCRDTWFPPPGSDTNPTHIFVSTTTTASALHDRTAHTLADVFTIYGEYPVTGAQNVCAGKGSAYSVSDPTKCICEVDTDLACGPCGANRMAGKTCKSGFRGIVANNVTNAVITGNSFHNVTAGTCDFPSGDGAFIAINVLNSVGVTISQNQVLGCMGGIDANGNGGATFGISVIDSQDVIIQSNEVSWLWSATFEPGEETKNISTGDMYGVYVDGGVDSQIRSNMVRLLYAGNAGWMGNGGATIAYHVNSQGGIMTGNNASEAYGSAAGNGYMSFPAGSCASTYGYEIVDSNDFAIERNNATRIVGCATKGTPVTNADGVKIAGTAAGFWITNSNVSLQYNTATKITGGAAINSFNLNTYGGNAFGYYLNTSLSLYFYNTAATIVKGTTGSMYGPAEQTTPVLGAIEAYVLFDTCDKNVTAAELCYPSGTTCCQSNCRARSSNTTCRASAGTCDAVDTCYYGTCPDIKSTGLCRALNGSCDNSELCNGVSNDCPADTYLPSGQFCFSSCGRMGTCTGSSPICPPETSICSHCMGYSNCNELTQCGSITQAGLYYITKDFMNYAGNCFTVNTNGVVLSGEGHTMGCNGTNNCNLAIYSNQYPVNATGFVFSGTFSVDVIQVNMNGTVANSKFVNVVTRGGYPVRIMNGAATLSNNVFTNVTTGYTAVYLAGVYAVNINNNVITNLTSSSLYDSFYAILLNNQGSYVSNYAPNSITNNFISYVTGATVTQSCASTAGGDVHGIYVNQVTVSTSVKNNTVQYITGTSPCPCNNSAANPSTRCKGGWTGGITFIRSPLNGVVSGNTVNYVYGSKGYSAGLVTGVYVDMGNNYTITNNAISNLFGGIAEVAGNTSDIVGLLCYASGTVSGNTISSLRGGFLPDTNSNSVKPGIHGTIYGIKSDSTGSMFGSVNITMANNNVNGLVGSRGANVVSPSTQVSGAGQSVIGLYSFNIGLSMSGTTVTSLTSGSPGSSQLGNTSVPGNVIGLDVINSLFAYSTGNTSGLALGDYDPTLVDASAIAPVDMPLIVSNISGCPVRDYEAYEFCYPPGKGTCFSTCIFHQCNFKVGAYSLAGQCNANDDSATVYGTAYNPDPFQYQVNSSDLSALAPSGNLNFTAQLANSGKTYVIHFNDSFFCSADLTVVVPAYSAPAALATAPVIDISSGVLNISAIPLNDSSNGALLNVSGYLVEYRTICNGNPGPWIPIFASADELQAGVTAQYFYQTTYQARVTVQNCKFNSTASPMSNVTTPANPNMPTITSIEPAGGASTNGGTITLIGANLPDLGFYVILDGGVVNCTNPQNVNENATTCEVPPGVGASHTAQIILDLSVHFSCVRQFSNVATWSYAIPNITGTSHVSTAGGPLMIYGANFGSVSDEPIVTIDENPCSECSVPYTNGSVIICNSCPGGYEQHPLVVVVEDQISLPFSFSYPICTPVCMHGVCVANDTATYCQCDSGFTGPTCSEAIVCASPQKSQCGLCSGSTCCFFRKKMDI